MTDKNTQSFILAVISDSTDIQFLEALRDLTNATIALRKVRSLSDIFVPAPKVAATFKVGDKVYFGRPRGQQRTGTIVKRNKTSYVINETVSNRQFRVDPSLISSF